MAIFKYGLIGGVAFTLALLVGVQSARADTIEPGGTYTSVNWTKAGSPYIVNGNVTIDTNGAMNIEPGVTALFTTGVGIILGNTPGPSTLTAIGTAAQPITFAKNPAAPGNWFGIIASPNAVVNLAYCDVGSAGYSWASGLFVSGTSNVQVRDCHFHNNQNAGIYLSGDGITPLFERVRLDGHSNYPIIQASANMMPTYHNLTVTGNMTDGVFIASSLIFNSYTFDGSSNGTGVPFYLPQGLGVGRNAAVHIAPGTTLKMLSGFVGVTAGADYAGTPAQPGTLIAEGTLTQPIIFTSAAAIPQPGDWGYILIPVPGSVLRLSNCDVSYAGNAWGSSLMVSGVSNVQVRDCRFHNNRNAAISLTGDGITPLFERVRLDGNNSYAIVQGSANMMPTYHTLTVTGNQTDGVYVDNPYVYYNSVTFDGSPDGAAAPFYFAQGLTVRRNAIVHIAPGTTLKMFPGTKVSADADFFGGPGTLIAEGTITQPIIFTSTSTTPLPGAWGGLFVSAEGALLRLSNCDIAYGGFSGWGIAAIDAENNATLDVQDCRIRYNTNVALWMAQPSVNATVKHIIATNNGYDEMDISGAAILGAHTWDMGDAGLPIKVNGTIELHNATTDLLIQAGTQLRMMTDTNFIVYGGLYALGTVSNPVRFIGANGTPGVWYGFSIAASGVARLVNCELSGGGKGGAAMLAIASSAVTVQNCNIHNSSSDGVQVTGNAVPTLKGNWIANNAFGLRNTGTVTVTALNHWWGDTSGPQHPARNPAGMGNGVSDYVAVSPWLSSTAQVVPSEHGAHLWADILGRISLWKQGARIKLVYGNDGDVDAPPTFLRLVVTTALPIIKLPVGVPFQIVDAGNASAAYADSYEVPNIHAGESRSLDVKLNNPMTGTFGLALIVQSAGTLPDPMGSYTATAIQTTTNSLSMTLHEAGALDSSNDFQYSMMFEPATAEAPLVLTKTVFADYDLYEITVAVPVVSTTLQAQGNRTNQPTGWWEKFQELIHIGHGVHAVHQVGQEANQRAMFRDLIACLKVLKYADGQPIVDPVEVKALEDVLDAAGFISIANAALQVSDPKGVVSQAAKYYLQVLNAVVKVAPTVGLDRYIQLHDASHNDALALDPRGWQMQLALRCAELHPVTCLGKKGTLFPVAGAVISGVDLSPYLAPQDSTYCHVPPVTAIKIISHKVVSSIDPNEKSGPEGAGLAHYVTGDEPLRYLIRFENQVSATAPAQTVVITDALNAIKLNLATLRIGSMTFGDHVVTPPGDGLLPLSADVDLRPAKNLIVHVTAGFDSGSSTLKWTYSSIDPATGQPTIDPLGGFLPPDNATGAGEGSVFFTVMPSFDLNTGTVITNHASIIFDLNPAITTNDWFNTIDNGKPSSSMTPLPAITHQATFSVTWSGSDADSGVTGYSVYVSENSGPYQLWIDNAPQSTALFDGVDKSQYAFYSIAIDAAGNREAAPLAARTTTIVQVPHLAFMPLVRR